jgi:hypothetical protein
LAVDVQDVEGNDYGQCGCAGREWWRVEGTGVDEETRRREVEEARRKE